MKARYRWEGKGTENYPVKETVIPFYDFNRAVTIGIQNSALHFTISQSTGSNAGRYFTNVGEIKDTTALITYLERLQQGSRKSLDPETLTRMFSRVCAKPQDQAKFNGVHSIQKALEILKKEPADSFFLTPGNGGYIKLEPGDKAYDRKGQQIWPPAAKPPKGYVLRL